MATNTKECATSGCPGRALGNLSIYCPECVARMRAVGMIIPCKPIRPVKT